MSVETELNEAEAGNLLPNGRTRDGKFAPGSKHAKGNVHNLRMSANRKHFLDAVTPEDIAMLAHRLLDQAMSGDTVAAKIYLEYACGRPKQSVELTGPAGQNIGIGGTQMTVAILGTLNQYPEAKEALESTIQELQADR